MVFQWDKNKAKKNLKKHQISFEEASTIFGDILSITIPDPLHSRGEERLVIIGKSETSGKTLVVSFTERGNAMRIISAWEASRHERTQYEEND